MLNLTLGEVASLSNGKLNDNKYENIKIREISRDTRTIEYGDLYLPIIGEKLNGHLFIDDAFNKGAVATFIQEGEKFSNSKPSIIVKNTLEAFQLFAKKYRESLDVKIIGITGSNGKTTTKDLISNVLSKKYKVTKTLGNLNNQIGLPVSISRLEKDTEIGVLELGMYEGNGGEVSNLSFISKPDIAIITNIGETHLDKLGSKNGILEEKIGIIDGLSKNGIIIYNYDDELLREKFKNIKLKQRIISYGTNNESDYIIKSIESNNNGNLFKLNNKIFNTKLIGIHQIYNASVAAIIGEIFNIEYENIYNAILDNNKETMRSELINCDGYDLLNDSYKSNPQSLRYALETLDILSGYKRKIAILGDMLELGDSEVELHRKIGKEIDPNKIDYLLLFGPLSRYIAKEAIKNFDDNKVFYFTNKKELINKAKYLIVKSSLVLVKASRSLHLEEVIESINNLHL